MECWYAINTKPHKESFCEKNFQRISLETFYPRLKEKRVIRRKYIWTTGPLFPGYIFCRFNLDLHYRDVQYTQGVKRIVTFGERPTPVGEEIISAIKNRCQDEQIVTINPPELWPGKEVEIMEGPLAGLRAIFDQSLPGKDRVVLLLNAMAYQARIVIPQRSLIPLPD